LLNENEEELREQLLNACSGIPECNFALFKPATNFQLACAELRNAIGTTIAHKQTQDAYIQGQKGLEQEQGQQELQEQFWTDRKFGKSPYIQGRGRFKGRTSKGPTYQGRSNNSPFTKKCFICNKPGCWSTNHSKEERARSYNNFKKGSLTHNSLSKLCSPTSKQQKLGKDPTHLYHKKTLRKQHNSSINWINKWNKKRRMEHE
jgi:hypothetical protein